MILIRPERDRVEERVARAVAFGMRSASHGVMTFAPTPMTVAIECASRAKPSATAIDACMRKPTVVSR